MRRLALACALVALTACSGSDDSEAPPVTQPPTPTIAIGLSSSAATVARGSTSSSTITLTRSGNYTGAVTLTAGTLPAGVTVAFAPSSLSGPTTTSAVTFVATEAATPGTNTITITAAGAGVASATVNYALTITGPAATPGVTVTAVAAQQLSQGTSSPQAIALVLTRTGGVTGDLTMSLEGAPAGVSAAFSPNPATGPSTQMILSASATAAPGTYTLTVRASAAGGVSGTTTFPLTVTAAAAGSFAINVVPGTLTVAQGQTGLATVNIARTGGFTGGVTLSATGLPAGTTANFVPAVPTGTQSQLGIVVGSNTPTGTYTVTVRGQGTGVNDFTTTLALTVTAAGGGGTGNVNWTFCDPTRFPLWFAVQNGTGGGWTRLTPSGGTDTREFRFTVTTQGGVAYAIPMEGGGVNVTVQYLTVAEMTSVSAMECAENRATKLLNGTVANLPAGGQAYIGVGGSLAIVTGPATNFSIAEVGDGVTDLVAIRTALNQQTFSFTPDRAVLRRNVNYANGSTMPVIDFTGSESFAVATADYTIANAGGDLVALSTSFLTANGDAGTFSFPAAGAAGAVQRVYGVPTDRTANGDLHQVYATAFSGSQSATSSRIVAQFNRTLANRTITLGAPLAAPTIANAGSAPYVRYTANGTWQSDYNDAVQVGYTQGAQNSNAWTLSLSRNYAGNAAAWTLAMPDFSAVPGFNPAWALGGGGVTWSVSATGGFVGMPGSGLTGFGEGGSFRVAARTGTAN